MFSNTFWPEYKDWKKKQHGISSTEIKAAGFLPKYEQEMQRIRDFDGKKVKVFFSAEGDMFSMNGEKAGRIAVEDGTIKFYEGRKRARFHYLDAGMFMGWYATLVPLKIVEV